MAVVELPFKQRTIAVVGLGYVGLPVALGFGQKFLTVGFDTNSSRIAELNRGHDRNGDNCASDIKLPLLTFSDRLDSIREATFYIVAVPTPIDEAKQPDLNCVFLASESVGKVLKAGDIVVYESTVYPGVTEETCVPVLEKFSGLKCGQDFKVGYSPERINPGDTEHTFTKIKKIVSGQDEESLEIIAEHYGAVVSAGVFRARSIRVAEAAKVIENTQRDLNIALMNELAIIFDQMGIDTHSVLEAASTKWNFLKFTPGLVGGHCIGVDPYYLTHKAERLNYHPQVILGGRRINDGMGKFIAQKTIREMIRVGHDMRSSCVTVLGLTFKENCRDIRNTKVIDIIRELNDYGVHTRVCDPMADPEEARKEYGIELVAINELSRSNAIVLAVAHRQFAERPVSWWQQMLNDKPVVIDVKSVLPAKAMTDAGIRLWRL